jgi:hypothetical protein
MLVIMAGVLSLIAVGSVVASANEPVDAESFPRSLASYGDESQAGIMAVIFNRIQQEPFNLVATIIFLCAIIHTFLTSKFLAFAHDWEQGHQEKIKKGLADKHSVHHGAELFHFLGEVEVVFGLWAVVLGVAIVFFYDWHTVVNYLSQGVNFTEPAFVVVIMTLASTRSILNFSFHLRRTINPTIQSLKTRYFIFPVFHHSNIPIGAKPFACGWLCSLLP